MNYYLIIRPLIGAGIGYITNWIAVKMMFWPRKAIKIGNHTLPFTPGIIPKNKSRLADSIGNVISNNLLTDEDLKKTLLSDDMKILMKEKIVDSLNNLTENDTTLKDTLVNYINTESYNSAIFTLNNTISQNIFSKLQEADIGNLIASQIQESANEKLKGSFMGLLGGKSIVNNLTNEVASKINSYIDENGENYISNMVKEQISTYENTTIGTICTSVGNSNINIIDTLMNVYETIILEKLPIFLRQINISKIVTNKINEMDDKELEKLILQIMKKELNALVNLGALIGFILGLFNLLF